MLSVANKPTMLIVFMLSGVILSVILLSAVLMRVTHPPGPGGP